MKVIEKITWDIETGEVLEEVSYYTDQKPVMCDLSPDVNVPSAPAKDATQIELEKEQLALLKEQNADTKALKPYLYQQAGYNYDADTGGVTKMSEDEYYSSLTSMEQTQYDYQKTLLAKAKDAAEGNLPVSKATTEYWTDTRAKKEEELAQKLGVGWKESTPGIQAMSELDKQQSIAEEAERTGQATSYENMMLANQNAILSKDTQDRSASSLLPSYGSSLLNNYSSIIAPYQNERMTKYGYDVSGAMQSSANEAAMWKGLMQMGGLMAVSKRSAKKDIKKITPKEEDILLEKMGGADVYEYNYKGEKGGKPKHIGVMADEAPKEITAGNRTLINRDNEIGLHGAAIRALAKKVNRLERRA